MNKKILKFPIPIEGRLDGLVMDFGDWKPELEEGLGLAEWSFKKIIEIASEIKQEFVELLARIESVKARKEWQSYLIWMNDILLMANKSLEKEK